jgi:hypothetical protein
MAARILVVRLLDKNGARLLDVEDGGGKNEFQPDANGPQVIHWKLHKDTPARFEFANVGLAAPGFAFVSNAKPNVFKRLELKNGRRLISINNYHLDADSAGTWYYILRVTDGTVEYSTTYDVVAGSTVQAAGTTRMTSFSYNNPNIINR